LNLRLTGKNKSWFKVKPAQEKLPGILYQKETEKRRKLFNEKYFLENSMTFAILINSVVNSPGVRLKSGVNTNQEKRKSFEFLRYMGVAIVLPLPAILASKDKNIFGKHSYGRMAIDEFTSSHPMAFISSRPYELNFVSTGFLSDRVFFGFKEDSPILVIDFPTVPFFFEQNALLIIENNPGTVGFSIKRNERDFLSSEYQSASPKQAWPWEYYPCKESSGNHLSSSSLVDRKSCYFTLSNKRLNGILCPTGEAGPLQSGKVGAAFALFNSKTKNITFITRFFLCHRKQRNPEVINGKRFLSGNSLIIPIFSFHIHYKSKQETFPFMVSFR